MLHRQSSTAKKAIRRGGLIGSRREGDEESTTVSRRLKENCVIVDQGKHCGKKGISRKQDEAESIDCGRGMKVGNNAHSDAAHREAIYAE